MKYVLVTFLIVAFIAGSYCQAHDVWEQDDGISIEDIKKQIIDKIVKGAEFWKELNDLYSKLKTNTTGNLELRNKAVNKIKEYKPKLKQLETTIDQELKNNTHLVKLLFLVNAKKGLKYLEAKINDVETKLKQLKFGQNDEIEFDDEQDKTLEEIKSKLEKEKKDALEFLKLLNKFSNTKKA